MVHLSLRCDPPNRVAASRTFFWRTRSPSMRLAEKPITWKYGLVLVLFVILSVLNAVAVEQDYYKVGLVAFVGCDAKF